MTATTDAPAIIAWERLTPDQRAAVLDYAEHEAVLAYVRGYDDATTNTENAFWAGVEFQRAYEDHVQGLARRLADTPPFDVLADRRGQHERAARQRQILAERGIA